MIKKGTYNFIRLMLISAAVFCLGSISSCNKEVSVTPPDAPPPNGFIYINSNPAHFNIYLDNRERRRATPDSLTWLSTGSYLITLKKELFNDTSISVDIVEGEKRSLFVDYTQNPSMKGKITCTSLPSKAEIFINDSSTGLHTPYTLYLMPGYYNIKYHLNNFRDDSVLVPLSSGAAFQAKLALVDLSLWEDFIFKNSNIPSENLTSIAIDNDDLIYLGSADVGFFSFDYSTKKWQVTYNSLSPTINCLTYDKSGILYVGTTKGYVVYTGRSKTEYGPSNSNLPDYNVNAIAIDFDGHLYIGTNKGLTSAPDWIDFSPSIIVGGKKVTTMITALTVDLRGNLWAGVNNYGIAKNTFSGSWKLYSTYNSKLINNNVTALAVSLSGEVWAGFERFTGSVNGFSYYVDSTWDYVYPIPGGRTNTFFSDKNHINWVGTDQGLIKFASTAYLTVFNHDNTGLNIDNVKGIAQDSKGNIWIATSKGLYKYKAGH
jgi:hypothetical protein